MARCLIFKRKDSKVQYRKRSSLLFFFLFPSRHGFVGPLFQHGHLLGLSFCFGRNGIFLFGSGCGSLLFFFGLVLFASRQSFLGTLFQEFHLFGLSFCLGSRGFCFGGGFCHLGLYLLQRVIIFIIIIVVVVVVVAASDAGFDANNAVFVDAVFVVAAFRPNTPAWPALPQAVKASTDDNSANPMMVGAFLIFDSSSFCDL
mmetsp:Transcript_17940/g.37272  ORF Transcript_17940/g.37272 Transcript_17940/m.37272 type:complete len:201 (-) Transcript_17940:99-701(-)